MNNFEHFQKTRQNGEEQQFSTRKWTNFDEYYCNSDFLRMLKNKVWIPISHNLGLVKKIWLWYIVVNCGNRNRSLIRRIRTKIKINLRRHSWPLSLWKHFLILLICVICTFFLPSHLRKWITNDSDFRRQRNFCRLQLWCKLVSFVRQTLKIPKRSLIYSTNHFFFIYFWEELAQNLKIF